MVQKILRLKEVMDASGKGRSAIYEGMSNGSFPKAIKLGPNSIGWLESDIEAYQKKLLADNGRQI